MRIIKTLAVLGGFAVPGTAVGFIIGGLLLPPDPTGRGAPGDGFLILYCMAIGLIISVSIAVIVAMQFIWRPRKSQISKLTDLGV